MKLKELRNFGTIMALVGMFGLLLNQFGINVDIEWLDKTADIACSILVILGVINNPSTKGLDNPFNKK